MFGQLSYSGSNISCELPATGGVSSSSGLGIHTPVSANQPNATGGIAPQLVVTSLDDGNAGTNCYQQLPGGYGAPSLQFLQQHTLQQMYNNPQQMYSMIQPPGGHLQLQVGSQTHSANAQTHAQSQQIQQTQAQTVHLLGAAQQYLLDDTTGAAAVNLIGSNVSEFGVGLNLPKDSSLLKKDNVSKSSGASVLCHICGRELRSRNLLKKHVLTMHEGDSAKRATYTDFGPQQTAANSCRLWCIETACGFHSETCEALATHLAERHARHLEKVNLHLASLQEFFSWKNSLEEANRVKFVLTSGSISRACSNTATLVFECHRSAMLSAQHQRNLPGTGEKHGQIDVMEKAVQEILPADEGLQERQKEDFYQMEITEKGHRDHRNRDEASSKKGRTRCWTSVAIAGRPCCAYIEVRVSLINGTVAASGCLSHVAHDPNEAITRPPDCVLGKLKGMLELGRSKEELSAEASAWTKHNMSSSSWESLENMHLTNSDLFPQIRSLTKRIIEHVSVIARLVSDRYWIDFMATVVDLFEVERRMRIARTTIETKLKDVSGEDDSRAKELVALEGELCLALLCHATDKHQLRKFLKYGLDCVTDPRLSDQRFQMDFSMALHTPVYDPAASLFRRKPESAAADGSVSENHLRHRNRKKAIGGADSATVRKRKYCREIIGFDDDSDYDCWSDEELLDIIPRRWPPPPLPRPSCTLEEKRLEKNLRRKQVPVLSVDPVLKEKILAMRAVATSSSDHLIDDKSTKETTKPSPKKTSDVRRKPASNAKSRKEKQHSQIKNVKEMKKLRVKQTILRRRKKRATTSLAGDHLDETTNNEPVQLKGCKEARAGSLARRKAKLVDKAKNRRNQKEPDDVEEKHLTEPIVIQEMKMDGLGGKKPRIVKILATKPGQSVDQTTIVVEAPPPTPQPEDTEHPTPMVTNTESTLRSDIVSLLRPGTSLLKGGRSLLKRPGAVSLLKPRDAMLPSEESNCTEGKGVPSLTPINNEQFYEQQLQQDFDEGPLQTPQPPRTIFD